MVSLGMVLDQPLERDAVADFVRVALAYGGQSAAATSLAYIGNALAPHERGRGWTWRRLVRVWTVAGASSRRAARHG